MSNLAQSLNAEIRRLARREANAIAAPLRRAITQLRRELWRLNRDNRALEKKLQQVPRTTTALVKVDLAAAATAKLGPKLIAKLRARLNLSQTEFAKLLDVSPNSISNWETGHSRPTAAMRARLVAVRGMGRRDVKRVMKEKAAAKKEVVRPQGRT